MKRIPLSQGKYALVDNCDYDYLMQWKWSLLKTKYHSYAARKQYDPDKKNHRRSIKMHRLIAGRAKLDCSGDIDHEDRNGLNNQRLNLRSASDSQNNANTVKRINNKSGFKGVVYHKESKRWIAQITVKGKKKYIGRFATRKQAAAAYDREANKDFGKFARLNNVTCQLINNCGTWSHNTSGFRGVSWNKWNQKWQCKIQVNKKQIYLGYFDDIIKAAKAYNKAAKQYFGPFAYQNKV